MPAIHSPTFGYKLWLSLIIFNKKMDNQNPIYVELQEYVVVGNDKQSSEGRVYSVQPSVTEDNIMFGASVEPQAGTSSCNSVKLISNYSIPGPEYKWNINDTKLLIDFYGKYKNKIGTMEIKNQKMLWEKIAREMEKVGMRATPNNCLNRWRVVERNYKKFVDNQNKTGRGRKFFEYESEMNDIFGKKKNIHPEIVLDAKKVDSCIETTGEEPSIETQEQEIAPKGTPTLKVIPRRSRPIKKKSITEKYQQDKKEYFEAKLQIERQKLEELKHRNRLIEERNEILKTFKCNCQMNSIL